MTAMRRRIGWTTALIAVAGGALAAPVGAALPPPAAEVIYTFGGGTDGYDPQGGLIADWEGSLYGTTTSGGATEYTEAGHVIPGEFLSGTVFKLTPNWRGGTWTWSKSILYSFRGGYDFPGNNDGRNPNTTLIADAQGALYGSTQSSGSICGAGTIFKLTPPANAQAAWSEQIVHNFCDGPGIAVSPTGLTMDRHGVLYGTGMPSNLHGPFPGVVFRLTPPSNGQSAWTETDIYNFPDTRDVGGAPYGGVIVDRQGALFGTATEGGIYGQSGTVFKLTPPAPGQTTWTGTALHQFAGGSDGQYPYGGLVADRAGALYGTTIAGGAVCGPPSFGGQPTTCGTVFRLAPPAAGQSSWAHTVLYSFKGGSDGSAPQTTLSLDWRGAIYGSTDATIFKLEPPNPANAAWTETVLYSTPPGPELGFGPVLVADWGSRLFAPIARGGTGCPNSYYGTQGCGTILEVPLRNHGFGPRNFGALQP